jgi:hypothetical protein
MHTWLHVDLAKEGHEVRINDKNLRIDSKAKILKVYNKVILNENGIRVNEKSKFPSLKK